MQAYREMDKLSEAKIPFVFIIDYNQEKIILRKTSELRKMTDILVHFPRYKNHQSFSNLCKYPVLESFPEKFSHYKVGFDIVQSNLHQGNAFLVNYTRKTPIYTNLTLEEIFYFSKAKYKILFLNQWVCFSPETFIQINHNKISTYPMKGTIDAEIPQAESILKNSAKETAEHYTTVDLLRNDLSMVARQVELKYFEKILEIKTRNKKLFTMSSKIEGELLPEYTGRVGAIFEKLLPAGSISGAPKKKVQQIIQDSETHDRGFYTGVAGYFDGENVDSCVLIRFIEYEKQNWYYKSGGGITFQSEAESEYQEMIDKIYVPIY